LGTPWPAFIIIILFFLLPSRLARIAPWFCSSPGLMIWQACGTWHPKQHSTDRQVRTVVGVCEVIRDSGQLVRHQRMAHGAVRHPQSSDLSARCYWMAVRAALPLSPCSISPPWRS